MSTQAVGMAIDRVRSIAHEFKSLKPIGRSGLDAKASGAAGRISAMIDKVASILSITNCLTSTKCSEQREGSVVCRGPGSRLFLIITPGRISVLRLADIKSFTYVEEADEWKISVIFNKAKILTVSSKGVSISLWGNQCMDVENSMDSIKQNYSNIQYCIGQIDLPLSRMLEGLRHIAGENMPQCLKE